MWGQLVNWQRSLPGQRLNAALLTSLVPHIALHAAFGCRGCMSVIARSPDGTIRLYCKGSDAKVMKKIRPDTPADLVQASDHNLHSFAQQGLRTLVLASKIIPEDVYASWDRRYQEAARSFQGRDAKLDALGMEMEQDLELIGVTAIEDKLQDGVPAAISTLIQAGIRVWMITGDKQETAVNIAVSCRLISDPQGVLMLNVNEKGESECASQRAGWLVFEPPGLPLPLAAALF